MNLERAEKLKALLRANASRFRMDHWFILDRPSACGNLAIGFERSEIEDFLEPECGTTACIAGFACHLSMAEGLPTKPWGTGLDFEGIAKDYLELESNEADILFFHEEWLLSHRLAYKLAVGKRDYPAAVEVACEMIDLIAEGSCS